MYHPDSATPATLIYNTGSFSLYFGLRSCFSGVGSWASSPPSCAPSGEPPVVVSVVSAFALGAGSLDGSASAVSTS